MNIREVIEIITRRRLGKGKLAIFFFGKPGVGKGERASWLNGCGFPVITTSNLFNGLPDDHEVKQVMKSGDLVDDGHVLKVIFEHLHDIDFPTCIGIDGAPRNVNQLEEIYKALKHFCYEAYVLHLDASDELCMERMRRRDVKESRLDKGLGKKRLEVYHKETDPVLARAEELGIPIISISITDVDIHPNEVNFDILKALMNMV